MWVVIRLLHQTQLLSLLLIQADRYSVLLLQALQGQDEQLGVMLVAQGREGYRRELAGLQPVHGRSVCTTVTAVVSSEVKLHAPANAQLLCLH